MEGGGRRGGELSGDDLLSPRGWGPERRGSAGSFWPGEKKKGRSDDMVRRSGGRNRGEKRGGGFGVLSSSRSPTKIISGKTIKKERWGKRQASEKKKGRGEAARTFLYLPAGGDHANVADQKWLSSKGRREGRTAG